MELVQPASADDPGRALWDKMQAEHDEQLSKHSMLQAPAAMPSEEDFTNLAVGWMAEGRYVASEVVAKRIYALFAPILAEKEREIERLYYHRQHWRGRADYWESRALAQIAAPGAAMEAP